MQSSPVRNAGMPRLKKCRPILESFSINAPVAARRFDPKPVTAMFIVRMLTSLVRQNKENYG